MGRMQPEQTAAVATAQRADSTSALFRYMAMMEKLTEGSKSRTSASFSSEAAMKKEPAEESFPTTTSRFLEEWREVESGHYEYILDDEPAPKPKVVLPAITKGVINISAVQQLQDKLEKAEAELKRLKENAAQDEKALRKQSLRDLSADQATELLENPVVMAKMKESLAAARAEENAKLAARIQERVTIVQKKLSDAEIRDLLTSNPTAREIFKSNLHKRLEVEKTKLETQIQERVEAARKQLSDLEMRDLLRWNPTAIAIFQANLAKKVEEAKKQLSEADVHELLMSNPAAIAIFEEKVAKQVEEAKKQLSDTEIREMLKSNPIAIAIFKIKLNKELNDEKVKITVTLKAEFEGQKHSAKEESNTEKANAGVLGGNYLSLRLSMMEDQLKRANAKLGIVEMAAAARPNITVKEIWGEVEQLKPAVPATVAAPAFPSPPNGQISFGAGISRLTTPFGYPVTALGSSPKATSPVIFGRASKPRSPLEVLSNTFSSPNLQAESCPKPEVQSNNNKAKVASETSVVFKRLRDTDDVGGSDAGSKKICKEASKE